MHSYPVPRTVGERQYTHTALTKRKFRAKSPGIGMMLRRERKAKDTIMTAGQKLIEQGIERGIVRSLINIYEARFGTMPEEIRAVIEATHDEPTLITWLTLAGTRGVDELTAAIRASRPN